MTTTQRLFVAVLAGIIVLVPLVMGLALAWKRKWLATEKEMITFGVAVLVGVWLLLITQKIAKEINRAIETEKTTESPTTKTTQNLSRPIKLS